MRTRICLGQLRRHPAGYLDEVSAGGILEVIRRGKIAALIVPEAIFSGPPASTVTASGLRRNAAPYFDRVADGDVISVVRDGLPVARIVAANTGSTFTR